MYYSEAEARRLVIEAGRRLREKKLTAGTWGSISARISSDEFIITPDGVAYDRLEAQDLVKVRVSDCSYDGRTRPDSEKVVHAAAYSLRKGAGCVICTHRFYAAVVSAECRGIEGAPCAGYGLPGTSKLRKKAEDCIKGNPYADTFLMARQGALIIGSDIEDTFEKAEKLEDRCRRLVDSRLQGLSGEARGAFDVSKIDIKALPSVLLKADKYILECCRRGETVGAYIDDFAQIVGSDMQVVSCDEWEAERALLGYSTDKRAKGFLLKVPMTGALDHMGGQQPALNSAIGRNAVLVKGAGAVCAGKDRVEAEAVAMAVSKNCAAACYVRYAKPLSRIDAGLQRFAYLSGRSRRRNG